MGVPILKQGRFLIVALQDELPDTGWQDLRSELLRRATLHRSQGVIVDVGTMDVMDSYSTRMLDGISKMLRFRGASTVVVGIQPGVAFAMSQLGLRLTSAGTALDLDQGLVELERRMERDRDGE